MSQPVANGPALSRTAFIVAWALASVVSWITTLLWWRISYEMAIGAATDSAEADRVHRIVHIVAWHLGVALNVLIEAHLLRQFRDDTRWWWILGITAALLMEPLHALVPAAATDRPIVDATMGLRMVGHLLWAALTWRLIQVWGWRGRYWLALNFVAALALPLVDHLGERVEFWTKILGAQVGITEIAALYVLGNLANGLLSAVILFAPTAWLLWQHVVVHRRSVDAQPRGA